VVFFLFHFLHFIFESFYFLSFYFVSNSNKPFNVCSSEKILLLVVDVFWCSSSGDALAFAHFDSSSHGLETLDTLGTMRHLNLGVWKNTLFTISFCLLCSFLFV
jgi:hypothetical protein